ncbi:MAG: hypothetical protein COT92_02735 [Candidatus Doudnabacteria bacterium CG10_big_fil_rev_8_21_14_0_10_42_18]|uniref:Ribosomal RNA large subunit methyltransferase K/L-like methyltransferase domain-containing protein n=1 Tax=Candidatus Doudnabacteria bacterium CG10_big_fil_rev_8_21_14_0_10_42_18 TaxID=1974552 RepID=A0A2H0VCR0_9BACT|nr:MAG: hypothetical protein COT92_02735 [Candidatus Doudnabacteria bacterium CG10_big_fil_rev_8_21_14_0_10_42_18]
MIYAFILGRVHTLSLAELFAVLEKPDSSLGLDGGPIKVLDASWEVLVIETTKQINTENLQTRLGGIVKILRIIDVIPKREKDSVNFAVKHYFKPGTLKNEFFKEYKGKKQFGVSIYLLDETIKAFGEPKRIGMMIKNTLTEGGSSVRVALPEFNSLSLASVVVTKNLLLEKGAEICLIAGKEKVYTAKTLTVQDFEDYGRRDYQRPTRDVDNMGMLPPKVAQIMLNLSQLPKNSQILDPFCGLGTILQEGMLLGYKMLGSDISKTAIHGSEQNLEWFRNRYKISRGKYHVEISDARKVSGLLNDREIAGVVTEGSLGPLYSTFPKETEIHKNFQNLEKLYKESFSDFSKFLQEKAKIIICLPAYKKSRDNYLLFPTLDWAKELGYTLLDLIPKKVAKQMKFLKLTERGGAIYDRKDQVVAREIVILQKI